MKKYFFIFLMLLFFSPIVTAEEQFLSKNEGIRNEQFDIERRKERERAFEQKLGLTEEQKRMYNEIKSQNKDKIISLIEQVKIKKREIEIIKLTRISIEMQNEKIDACKNDIAQLKKQIRDIKKKNMKEFERILTFKQKIILNQMKKEARQKMKHNCKNCRV